MYSCLTPRFTAGKRSMPTLVDCCYTKYFLRHREPWYLSGGFVCSSGFMTGHLLRISPLTFESHSCPLIPCLNASAADDADYVHCTTRLQGHHDGAVSEQPTDVTGYTGARYVLILLLLIGCSTALLRPWQLWVPSQLSCSGCAEYLARTTATHQLGLMDGNLLLSCYPTTRYKAAQLTSPKYANTRQCRR